MTTKKFDLRTASLDELRQKIKELQDDIATVEIDGEKVDLRKTPVKNAKGGSLNDAIARVKKEQGFRNGGKVSLGNFKGSF